MASLDRSQVGNEARIAAVVAVAAAVTVVMVTPMANMEALPTATTLSHGLRQVDTLPNISSHMARSSNVATEARARSHFRLTPFTAALTQATLEASLAWLLFRPT